MIDLDLSLENQEAGSILSLSPSSYVVCLTLVSLDCKLLLLLLLLLLMSRKKNDDMNEETSLFRQAWSQSPPTVPFLRLFFRRNEEQQQQVSQKGKMSGSIRKWTNLKAT